MTLVEPGTLLAGKYRVTKLLGEGGMGVVVAALHVQLDQLVALKFMLPAALGSPEAVNRFLREARAAVRLRSEHVARVTDVGTLDSGAPYIVMEYLEGTDLAGVLAARGALPAEEAVDYVLQACDALAEAHSLGIVHRDLKPANLFLTRRRDGSALVKVLDFGISKSSTLNEQGTESLTKTGGIMGSPLYMSPEQMKSAKSADARTDVWALGIILYELVGGRAPFDADTLGGLMAQVLTEEPPPLPTLRPGLPPPLYEAIARALEKDRGRRWANVAELAAALSPVASARTRPIVDRVAALLRASPEAGVVHRPAAASSPALRASRGATAPGWAEASTAPIPVARRKGLVIGVAGLVATIAIAIGVTTLRRTSLPAPVAAAPAVLVTDAAPGPNTPPATSAPNGLLSLAASHPDDHAAPSPESSARVPSPDAILPIATPARSPATSVVTRKKASVPAAAPALMPAPTPLPVAAPSHSPSAPPTKPAIDVLETSN